MAGERKLKLSLKTKLLSTNQCSDLSGPMVSSYGAVLNPLKPVQFRHFNQYPSVYQPVPRGTFLIIQFKKTPTLKPSMQLLTVIDKLKRERVREF